MLKLLIATSNPAKLDEIRRFLGSLPVEAVSLKDINITDSVEETGKSFKDNAILKAQFYCNKSGLPTIADDGGFEINALNGEPGVKSHRWVHGNRDSTDEELIEYTLKRMWGLPRAKRRAQLHLVLAFVTPDGRLFTSRAVIRGIVPEKESQVKTKGFPYRSLLFIPEMNKFYDRQLMTEEEEIKYNHRRKAVLSLLPEVKKYFINSHSGESGSAG